MNGLFITRANAMLDGMLAFLADNGGGFPTGEAEGAPRLPRSPRQQDWGGMGFDSPETPFITRHFSVLLDESGEALNVNTDSIAAVSADEAVLYAQRCSTGRTAAIWTSTATVSARRMMARWPYSSTPARSWPPGGSSSSSPALWHWGSAWRCSCWRFCSLARRAPHRPERRKAAPVHHRRWA